MHRAFTWSAALFLSGAFAAVPAGALAQTKFDGRFNLDARASDDMSRPIDAAVRQMNIAMRPFARRYMARALRPPAWLTINSTSSRVTITTDRATTTTPTDGSRVRLAAAKGEVHEVSTRWVDGRIERTLRMEGAERVSTYSMSPDGSTLTVSVRWSSPRLPQPIAYRLVYARAP